MRSSASYARPSSNSERRRRADKLAGDLKGEYFLTEVTVEVVPLLDGDL